ncbi:hypothetical protein D3C72_2117760 [compost metagenome]
MEVGAGDQAGFGAAGAAHDVGDHLHGVVGAEASFELGGLAVVALPSLRDVAAGVERQGDDLGRLGHEVPGGNLLLVEAQEVGFDPSDPVAASGALVERQARLAEHGAVAAGV